MSRREGKATPAPPGSGVLDPQWEDALRAGQEADGKAGSVEDELAVIHLLRHAAAPEELGDGALEQVWQDVEPAITHAPWWRKFLGWRVAGPALAAAAAAAVIVIVWPSAPPAPETESVATVTPEDSTADLLAMQFEMLAPAARDDIDAGIDKGRTALRGDLLALAVGDNKTIGGAP